VDEHSHDLVLRLLQRVDGLGEGGCHELTGWWERRELIICEDEGNVDKLEVPIALTSLSGPLISSQVIPAGPRLCRVTRISRAMSPTCILQLTE
jgi:hypothetical protein